MELTLKAHCCLCNSMLFRNNSVCNVAPLEHDRVQRPSLQGRGGAGCKTMDGPGSPRNGPQELKETSKAVTMRPKFQKICPELP